MKLHNIQDHFKSHLAGKNRHDEMDKAFRTVFKDDSISIEDRLHIYRNNLNVSLQRVLIQRHSILEAIVGPDFLQALVREYAKNNLPDHGNLNEYGFDLPSFIDGFEHTKSMPYLGDVARLECAWWRSYYAPDATPLNAKALAEIPQDQLVNIRFDLHPSVGLIRSNYPVFSIRNMAVGQEDDSGEQVSAPISPNAAADPTQNKAGTAHKTNVNTNDATDTTLDFNCGGEFGMVLRPHLRVDTVQLDERHLKFLVYLRAGHTIGEAYGKVLAKFSTFNLVDTLKGELHRGTFISYHIS